MTTSASLLTTTKAARKTNRGRNNKRMPAFGRQLMEIRHAGKIPSRIVLVTFDWKLARAYPRIVISDDCLGAELNFDYLAGLPVKIIYRNKNVVHLGEIIRAILDVNPSYLATFALDLVGTGDAVTLIKPYLNVQVAVPA